jgi:hypothetical protein
MVTGLSSVPLLVFHTDLRPDQNIDLVKHVCLRLSRLHQLASIHDVS